MSSADLRELHRLAAFRPRFQFELLAEDHVPFDELTGSELHERRISAAVTSETVCAAVIAPSGAGKSSLIAHVCRRLADDHVHLRVPVASLEDPGDPAVLSAMILDSALRATDMEAHQRQALERAQAERVVELEAERSTSGEVGAVLGKVHVELGSLTHQRERSALAAERLRGLDRMVDIFTARGLRPVIVIEDTDAMVGVDPAVAERFFHDGVRLLAREIEASSLIAVQTEHATTDAYLALAPGLREFVLPDLGEVDGALERIVEHRLRRVEIAAPVGELVASEAFDALTGFYAEMGRSLRHVLAAIDAALEHAMEGAPDRLEVAHIQYGIEAWRTRRPR